MLYINTKLQLVDLFLSTLREPQGATKPLRGAWPRAHPEALEGCEMKYSHLDISSKLTWSPDNSATMNSIQGRFY